jgi:hypothetical protein
MNSKGVYVNVPLGHQASRTEQELNSHVEVNRLWLGLDGTVKMRFRIVKATVTISAQDRRTATATDMIHVVLKSSDGVLSLCTAVTVRTVSITKMSILHALMCLLRLCNPKSIVDATQDG